MEDASAEEEKTETDDHPAEKLKVTNEYLEAAEELINRSNAYRQSAISITVGIHKDDSISVDVSAGRYTTLTSTDPKTEKVVSQYLRKQITWNNEGRSVNLPLASDGILRIPVGETMLCFDITFRYQKGDCLIYTFTLENSVIRPAAFKVMTVIFRLAFLCLQSLDFAHYQILKE